MIIDSVDVLTLYSIPTDKVKPASFEPHYIVKQATKTRICKDQHDLNVFDLENMVCTSTDGLMNFSDFILQLHEVTLIFLNFSLNEVSLP